MFLVHPHRSIYRPPLLHFFGQAKLDRPGYPETHIILAETLYKGGHQEEAEQVIEEAWDIFSRDELPDGVPDSTLIAVQLNLARCFPVAALAFRFAKKNVSPSVWPTHSR